MKINSVLYINLIDIEAKTIYPAEVKIRDGFIKNIRPTKKPVKNYILPGFVDAHVHIESSMLVPSEFAKMAVPHGTVATVSDPHEIANVCGMKGIKYMIDNGKTVPFKFNFGAPSCVPATSFETAGAEITAKDIRKLLESDDVKYLAEMMNWPGVLNKDPMVMEKIAIAQEFKKPVDGHAPGLKGKAANDYTDVGITTDHECFTLEEALDKIKYGMSIQIREGSAARNFDTLEPLIKKHSDTLMFCSDDKHPDDLELGHINLLVKRALAKGNDLFDVLRIACINPVKHYNLDVGLMKKGDPADFIIIDNPEDFNILETRIDGEVVARNQESWIKPRKARAINNFTIGPKKPNDFEIKATGDKVNVIDVIDGEIVTQKGTGTPKIENGNWVSNPEEDLLKIVVVNRYNEAPVSIGFTRNFNLVKGALASSVAHDSHNIIAVGVSDKEICKAVNKVIEHKGGLSLISDEHDEVLALPVAGLMTNQNGLKTSKQYTQLLNASRKLGCKLRSPYMSMSFLALLVIPSIKLSDKGLFDGEAFKFISLEA